MSFLSPLPFRCYYALPLVSRSDAAEVVARGDRKAIKAKFAAFNEAFEQQYNAQRKYAVPDSDLRSQVRPILASETPFPSSRLCTIAHVPLLRSFSARSPLAVAHRQCGARARRV